MDSTEFFGGEAPAPDPQGYDRYGRYLLDADGTGQKSYTRATTLAKTLDDTTGLSVWQQRKAAKGVAISEALTARAKVTPLDDKRVWREILAQADVKSGGDEKRDWGSAFHEFHERVPAMTDEEYAAQAVELRVTYERYRAELDRLGITEVLTEGTCVNEQIGSAGKFDAVFRLADGRLVIGDRKTGRVVEYPHAPAVQLAVYANASVLIEFGPDGEQIRKPMPDVDKDIAIVVDITVGDEGTAAVHVYELDIHAGWYGALLAAKVRRWRNRKDLLAPYHPEFPPAERAQAAAAIERPAERLIDVRETGDGPTHFADYPVIDPPRATPEQRAEFAAELPPSQVRFPTEVAHGPAANAGTAVQPDHLGGALTQQPHAAHPITKQAWSSAEQRNITLNPDGTRADGLTGPQVSAIVQPPIVIQTGEESAADIETLLATFKTKAQLQTAAKTVGLTNVSRQRKNLAADMVAHPNWPNVRADLITDPVARVQEASDEAAEVFSPVVTNAPGPVPPDPEPKYGERATDSGMSVGYEEAQQISVNLDAPGLIPDGPPAANPFRPAAAPAPVPVKTREDELAERIAAATTTQEIADVWDAANEAGLGWPPRLHQAATIRTKQIEQEG